MSQLFQPLTLHGVTFRNRIWVAPMCQYSCEERDGMPSDWHLMHLGQFAAGGAGLVMTEATAVSPEGRISPQDTGLWNDGQVEAWRRISTFVRAQGAVAGIQLAHAGRKASTYRPWAGRAGTVPADEGGWPTVSASPVAFHDFAPPRELDEAGIERVVADFAAAARRAVEAGFQVLEVHAAHGYLLHQFLSPLTNQRTDQYGGSLENRARLLLRVVGVVRQAAPQAVVFVRFSATDWLEGGWDVEQTVQVARWASEGGADFFDISSGGLMPRAPIPVGPGYQVPLAARVRHGAGVSVSAVGLITSAEQAEEILNSGAADAVMVAREMLRDPHFALRAAEELGVHNAPWPSQYVRGRLS
ncbi:MAG TPA: NADH:flavin oxidoreductase/NADH oxidase [Polyangiaceae bacterium]|nr:NADH:flavin oxidoreductase/NADH oxidase [Polyangiaceae bacterium]